MFFFSYKQILRNNLDFIGWVNYLLEYQDMTQGTQTKHEQYLPCIKLE